MFLLIEPEQIAGGGRSATWNGWSGPSEFHDFADVLQRAAAGFPSVRRAALASGSWASTCH